MSRLLKTVEVAHQLDCSDDTVRKLVRLGLLPEPLYYDGLGMRHREEDVIFYKVSQSREARTAPPKGDTKVNAKGDTEVKKGNTS